MSSQFFGLNIAYSGLLASNAALNTTANNISNVQTEGYSRQQVVQQAADAIRVFQTYGCAGAGVETLAIERIRDEFYDTKYWNNNTQVGEYDSKQYYMKQIESYFADDGVSTGFTTIFNNMMVSSLEELLKDPSSATAKTQFIGSAQALTEYFNGLYANMQNMQKDGNEEIKITVNQINSIATEIATLNNQINTIELSGGAANELRDRRTLLLDKLSLLVDVKTQELPITDANDPTRVTGGNRFIVQIAGGQTLVDGSEYYGLECVARTSYEKINQTDIDGLYDVYWASGQKFNLYNVAMGGSLQGLIQMRDGNNGESFKGTVSGVGKTEDGSQDTVTIKATAEYLTDLNKSNLSNQGGVINLGNQEFYYDSWEYSISYDESGSPVYSYTFILSDATKNTTNITNDRVGKSASIGASINYQGIPYYMSQMNEWIRTFSQKFNDILNSGYDTYGNAGNSLFTGNHKTEDDQYDFTEEYRYDSFTYEAYETRVNELVASGMSEAEAKKAATFTVKTDDPSYYALTAGNFTILSAMLEDGNLLANRFDLADGVEQNDLLLALKDLATNKETMSFRGASASEFLQNMLSDVALNASKANRLYKSYTAVSKTINNQRLSISGVDEDEEAINLVKFQNGYSLASKMIQTLTEVYDRLILQTGV